MTKIEFGIELKDVIALILIWLGGVMIGIAVTLSYIYGAIQ